MAFPLIKKMESKLAQIDQALDHGSRCAIGAKKTDLGSEML